MTTDSAWLAEADYQHLYHRMYALAWEQMHRAEKAERALADRRPVTTDPMAEVRAATTEAPTAPECSHPAWTHIGSERYCASCGVDQDDLPPAAPDTGGSETGEPVEGIDWAIVTKAEAHQFCRPECCRAGEGETTVEWGVRWPDGLIRRCPGGEHIAREMAAWKKARPFCCERTTYPDRVTDWQEVPADE